MPEKNWTETANGFKFGVGELVRHKTCAHLTYVVISRSIHEGEIHLSRQYLVETLVPSGPSTTQYPETSLEKSNTPNLSVGAAIELLESVLIRDRSDGDEVMSKLDDIRDMVVGN